MGLRGGVGRFGIDLGFFSDGGGFERFEQKGGLYVNPSPVSHSLPARARVRE